MSTSYLYQAIESVTEDMLRSMVLDRQDMPQQYLDFELLREGILENSSMAERSLRQRSASDLRAIGRVTGFVLEFTNALDQDSYSPDTELMVGSAVHLFDHTDDVSRWMNEVFVGDFERAVPQKTGEGKEIALVVKFSPEGLTDDSVGLFVSQEQDHGLISTTIVDFRLGKLLGVTYMVTAGDVRRGAEVESLAQRLERKVVSVVLGPS